MSSTPTARWSPRHDRDVARTLSRIRGVTLVARGCVSGGGGPSMSRYRRHRSPLDLRPGARPCARRDPGRLRPGADVVACGAIAVWPTSGVRRVAACGRGRRPGVAARSDGGTAPLRARGGGATTRHGAQAVRTGSVSGSGYGSSAAPLARRHPGAGDTAGLFAAGAPLAVGLSSVGRRTRAAALVARATTGRGCVRRSTVCRPRHCGSAFRALVAVRQLAYGVAAGLVAAARRRVGRRRARRAAGMALAARVAVTCRERGRHARRWCRSLRAVSGSTTSPTARASARLLAGAVEQRARCRGSRT